MKRKELTYKDILIWMSGQKKKMAKKEKFSFIGYDVTIHHLFVTDGCYGFSIECEPCGEIAETGCSVPIDVEALSIGIVRVDKSDIFIPDYSEVLNLDKNGAPEMGAWGIFSKGFQFEPSVKESKDRAITNFYVRYRINIALHYMQNIPNAPYWEIYHYRSGNPGEVITHAVLFHAVIDGRNAYYIVMPMLIEDFNPSILPEYIKEEE